MKISEVSRPKIGKRITDTAFKYFRGKGDSDTAYAFGGQVGFEITLSKLGWTRFGNGNFSSVYSNPKKNYIMKISDKPDEGYAEYVNLIKKTRNKHFPKISDIKFLEIPVIMYHVTKDVKYYVYLIEKLYSININTIQNGNYPMSATTAGSYCHSVAYNYWKDLTTVFSDNDEDVPKFLKRNPSLVQALQFVGKNASVNVWLDIKGENLMQRLDGTIVITDPYAEN